MKNARYRKNPSDGESMRCRKYGVREVRGKQLRRR